jgi:class 3 adenylate cyclase/ABC-type phosphate transport system substrate-binding protein
VIVNLPGKPTGVVVPVCALVEMMLGNITHWDDPKLRATFDGTTAPHKPVRIIARSGRSGTIEVFTEGLAREDRNCNGGVQRVQAGSTWLLKADSVHSSADAALVETIETPYSITIVSKSTAQQLLLPEATLLYPNGAEASTDTAIVVAALEAANYDPATNVVAFVRRDGVYPFIGVTYFAYHAANDQAGVDCVNVKRATDFMMWCLLDSSAKAQTAREGSVAVPMKFVDAEMPTLRSVTCNGNRLYPEAAADDAVPAWLIAIICVLVVIVVAAAAGMSVLTKGDARDVKNAPKEGQVTLLFTDIQDSTKLWSNCPASMSAALEVHHMIIRDAIQRHKAYEVKTVGDCFMIACGKVEAGVQLAVDVQHALQATRFPAALSECYAVEDAFVEVDDDPQRLAELDPVWNGLRVRIGIHTGHPECCLDVVTKGYDYYGNDVNISARVESVARGGQVLCTKPVAEAVANLFKVQDMGAIELKGVAGLTPIFNIVCPDITARAFNAYTVVTVDDTSTGRRSIDAGSEFGGMEDSSRSSNARKSTMMSTASLAVDAELDRFAFVRDGTMSLDVARVLLETMVAHYDGLFKVLRGPKRTKIVAELCTGWRVQTASTKGDAKDDSTTRLALKVMPLVVSKSAQFAGRGQAMSFSGRPSEDGMLMSSVNMT